MAEVVQKFRVVVDGVEQDVQYCYNHLANKPEFKTINGKKIFITSGDTEANMQLATSTQVNQALAAAATAQQEISALDSRVDIIADNVELLTDRVENLEVNGGGGGGSIIVDDVMSNTSTNAVQNKVVKEYVDTQIEKKQNALVRFNLMSLSAGKAAFEMEITNSGYSLDNWANGLKVIAPIMKVQGFDAEQQINREFLIQISAIAYDGGDIYLGYSYIDTSGNAPISTNIEVASLEYLDDELCGYIGGNSLNPINISTAALGHLDLLIYGTL